MMLNGVADSRESSSLSELSHPTHNIMCYKINVIHTTRLNSKVNSKKEDKYLISMRLLLEGRVTGGELLSIKLSLMAMMWTEYDDGKHSVKSLLGRCVY